MPEHMTVTKFREGAMQSLLCYRESSSVTVCKYPKRPKRSLRRERQSWGVHKW